jgi:diguanylate cyclase (GGDEF)-like protein
MQTQILGLVAPLSGLILAMTFVLLWRAGRMQRHVLGFGIAYALASLGFLATHFLPTDAFYLFHSTQLFYTLGSVVMLVSVCERAGQRFHLGSAAVVYLISALTLAVAVIFSNDVASRLVIVNMGYGVLFAMGVTTLLTAQRRDALSYAIMAVMAFQAVDFLIRPSLALLFERSIPAELYRESVYYSLIGLVLAVKALTLAVVLIAVTVADWNSAQRESSERDVLTGLLNRGSFEPLMANLLTRAQIEGRPLSLIVADIDFFKQVNDIWGHQAGDEVITSFGTLIGKTIRECDIAARVGGEEFCIAVWNCANEPAHRLADRVRQAFVCLEHASLKDEIRVTASFGLATARDGETYKQLFARADEALYRAKSNGRNRVEGTEAQRLEEPTPEPLPMLVELQRAVS